MNFPEVIILKFSINKKRTLYQVRFLFIQVGFIPPIGKINGVLRVQSQSGNLRKH